MRALPEKPAIEREFETSISMVNLPSAPPGIMASETEILAAGSDFEDSCRHRFFEIVSNADLSCPLERNILDKARDALIGGRDAQKYAPLFEE